jgi:hypothetical protein
VRPVPANHATAIIEIGPIGIIDPWFETNFPQKPNGLPRDDPKPIFAQHFFAGGVYHQL